MRNLFLASIVAVCIFTFTGVAQAVPYLDVITWNQNMTRGDSHTFNFNLNSDALAIGDIGTEDILNSAMLGINFKDDELDRCWRLLTYEFAAINTDGAVRIIEVDSGLWTANVLSKVYNDHTLGVTVTAIFGDFTLGNSSLSGDYTDRPATSPVPEPTTLSLLGLGLVGLLGFRRKS